MSKSTWVRNHGWTADRIAALARRAGGNAKLGALIGVHEVTVSRWRSGSTSPPSTRLAALDALERAVLERT